MDGICLCAVLICGTLYAVVGFCGYAAFGYGVEGNVLLSYPSGDLAVAAARAGISGLVIISYPLMCKPARDSIMSLLRHSDSAWHQSLALEPPSPSGGSDGGYERRGEEDRSSGDLALLGFRAVTVAFLIGTFIVAMSMISNPGKRILRGIGEKYESTINAKAVVRVR